MTNVADYSRWRVPDSAIPDVAAVALGALFAQLYRQHWGPAQGTEDIVSTYPTLMELAQSAEGAAKRLGSVLASAAIPSLEDDVAACTWARRALDMANAFDVPVRALRRHLGNAPEGTRTSGDGILSIEAFSRLACSDGAPEGHLRTILDLSLNGTAVLPGTRGQRELWNWLLTTALPWALSPQQESAPKFDAQALLEARQAPRRPAKFERLFSSANWDRSASNVRTDFYGDWYNDRWTWPELSLLASEPYVRSTIASFIGAPHWSIPVRVPKSGGGFRPGVLLGPRDRLLYQVLVDSLVDVTSQGLKAWAFGWKAAPRSAHRMYARRDEQWEQYVAALKAASAKYEFALHVDIHQYFASIPLDALLGKLAEGGSGRHHEALEALRQFLQSWQGLSSQSGLPQRCLGSSVLADFYLRTIDEYLDALGADKTCAAVRWMDDIWVFSSNAGTLQRVQVELRDRLSADGLFENRKKSTVCSPHEVLSRLAAVHVEEPEGHEKALANTVQRVVRAPADASRTLIRFVCKGIKDGGNDELLQSMLSLWWELQQGSDYIAVAGESSSGRARLVDEFLRRLMDPNPLFEWVLGNYARMFSGVQRRVESGLVDIVQDRARGSALRALGASALASPGGIRHADALADLAGSVDDALVARSVALTLHGFGGKYHEVAKETLRGFEELSVLEAYIERDPEEAPPAEAPSYSGDSFY